MYFNPFEKNTVFKLLHPLKAAAPMLIIVSGITTVVMLFFSNALSPIAVTLYPSIFEGITRADEYPL